MKLKQLFKRAIIWLKSHPDGLHLLLIATVGIVLQIAIIYQSINPLLIISESSLFQVMATSAEIIAGLYGLILTGYIFFLDGLQDRAEENEMLEDIVALLKKRYNKIVIILSLNCYIVIIMAIGLILYGTENHMLSVTMYRFLIYETLLLIFTAVTLIVYFVLALVDPDKIARISRQYKQRMNGDDSEYGNLQEFLADYDDIEELLREKYQKLATDQIGKNPLEFSKKSEILKIRKFISDKLWRKLTRISQYYSYMIFSGEMTVSKEICELTKEVKQELSKM